MKLSIFFVVLFHSLVWAITSQSKEVKLVTGLDYAPYASPDSLNGGVITEIVSLVFSEIGYQSTLGFYPWNRALKRVDRLKSDATFPYAHTKERAEKFYFSHPVHKIKLSIFQKRGQARPFAKPEDLIGLINCEPLGYKTEIELVDLIETRQIERFSAESVDGCLERLASGPADFVVMSPSVAWAAADRLWKDEAQNVLSESEIPLNISTEHLIISKKHPHGLGMIEAFNAKFLQLLDSGAIKEVWIKHLGKDSTPLM
ncbi:hypothetical protein WH96_16375 [Kiloniella spongiae]|uniref:Solute-binding protein family 3/N-terminal domain-containing protein n=1 Tax=Kiloniella spongiae TaxID=1489064 RepID=A0A0H2MSJ6_9PROT|nr:transporter substrate-binding domain-containing protein [Kiloniella spongiae]KLN59625.1 hypothetical protein WH96_16375 [Kiloniella spongiae]